MTFTIDQGHEQSVFAEIFSPLSDDDTETESEPTPTPED